jgi:broad specificity phosphatase PhoE
VGRAHQGISLGVLAGLSRDEALLNYPEAAQRLELWRKGCLKIDKLLIPSAEPVDSFKERVAKVLNEWVACNSHPTIVAVCTRSTLIMMTNLITLADTFSYSQYRVYEFIEGSLTEIDIIGSSAHIFAINSNQLLA